MIEVNLQMLLYFHFYGKEFQSFIMVVNNIMLVELIQIIESLYGIIIILELKYIEFYQKLMLLENKLVFGTNLLFKDMLMIISMLSLEEMSLLVSLILLIQKEPLLIMNLVKALNCATSFMMEIVLVFLEEVYILIWGIIRKFM